MVHHNYMLLLIMVNITWTHEYKPLASVFFGGLNISILVNTSLSLGASFH